MGMYPGGLATDRVDVAGIAEAMRPALYLWFSARIIVLDPNNRASKSTRYDPLADTGGPRVGNPITLWDSGSDGALVMPIRLGREATIGDQATAIQGMRVQCKRIPHDIPLRSGLWIRVIEGGEDGHLEDFIFGVEDGIDSSLQWGEIFNTTVIMSATINSEAPIPSGGGYGTGGYGE